MQMPVIQTMDDMVEVVNQVGLIPFFQNDIPGFSIEEHTPPDLLFEGKADGPWEWREELLAEKSCIYGKFFAGKTGFISLEWFPDFANYRRDGYDRDAFWDDGLLPHREKHILDLIETHGLCPSPELRRLAGIEKGKASSFEGAMTKLQMRTYLLPAQCIFGRRSDGSKYGYGTLGFDLAEKYWGEKLCTSAYQTEPKKSYEKMLTHLSGILGNENKPKLEKLLRFR